MQVQTENLLYDDANPLCSMLVTNSQGKLYAFITCLDVGGITRKPKKCDQRKYWGAFSWDNQEAAIQEIMNYGGKWSKFEK